MIKFKVQGPYEIEPIHVPGGKLIDKSAVEKFWSDDGKSELAECVGCYVFGFRSSKGTVPAYVGQAKTGFRNECFDYHKLAHYNSALVKRKSGTPVMFFVCKEEGSTHCARELHRPSRVSVNSVRPERATATYQTCKSPIGASKACIEARLGAIRRARPHSAR